MDDRLPTRDAASRAAAAPHAGAKTLCEALIDFAAVP